MDLTKRGGEVAAVPPNGGADTGTSSLDRAALVTDLRKQVLTLEVDLRERSDNVQRYRERHRIAYEQARKSHRTASTYGAWRDEHITQAAVAWVLGTVFLRFCEDNRLIGEPFLSGPGLRLAEAVERHRAYFAQHPETNDRDWLLEAFTHLERSHEAMARIFDRKYNPLWGLSPSPEAAASLVAFWRRRGRDGSIRFDFADPELDTRFLGDLYEDISDVTRKFYGLIQTPHFIADFILDLTLDPAIAAFGPRDFRGIDPACGSGTFLLGLFWRLLNAWRLAEPGTPDRELIPRAMESVHGCDINPFAVSIARFRLLMAATRVSGSRALDQVPGPAANVAVGDSLLEGHGVPGGSSFPLLPDWMDESGRTSEDIHEFSNRCDLLGRGSYHVVLGEPPFITVRDKAKSTAYRNAYATAAGNFPLSVPFAERMFDLAIRRTKNNAGGYVGQFTSSSFAKRAFGEKLIDDFFPHVGLTHVIDTSGVFVPNHGTPTLILVGRNDPSMRATPVRSVFGVNAEPRRPVDPAEGIVWKAILHQVDQPGTTSEWVSVQDEPRQRFSHSPWTLTGGGGRGDLMDLLAAAPRRLADVLSNPAGIVADPGQREVFALGQPWFVRHPDSGGLGFGMITSETVRDWRAGVSTEVLAPYDLDGSPLPLDLTTSWGRHLWSMQQPLRAVPGSQGSAQPWWTWRRWPRDGTQVRAITLAHVAAHNHFALELGGKAFSRTAPVLRLSPTANKDEYVALLGILNSSTVCFWLKQVNSSIGADGPGNPRPGEDWAQSYAFAASSLPRLPLPDGGPLVRARALDNLGRLLNAHEPSAMCAGERPPSRKALDEMRAVQDETRHQMTALQEELDWEVYGSYGLLADDQAHLTTPPGFAVPTLRPGERAFEIVLARKVLAGKAANSWFARNGAPPVVEIPERWPAAYRKVVKARIEAIESQPTIALVERPEHKRRWSSEPWQKREQQALRSWLLDRCEDRQLWFEPLDGLHPRPRTVDQLAQDLGADAELLSVAVLYATDHLGKRDATLSDVLTALLATEHVPYMSALRYSESGLRKRAQWEQVWELQRSEDRTGEALGIPVPPKFSSHDFRGASYWSHRGSLDIPRERFLSYPDDTTKEGGLLLGWSGWSETDRVRVLLDLISRFSQGPQQAVYELTPLLAGIQELLPWVRQWEAHTESGSEPGRVEAFQQRLTDLRTEYGISTHDLTSWRPRRTTSGAR